MDQLRNFADNRLINGCIYCGGPEDTREHVPSKVFLDPPFPDNLPIVAACKTCNNSFSLDEEYFACLMEVMIAGSTNPDHVNRPKIANILRRSPQLKSRLESAKYVKDSQTYFKIEAHRIENIILKLAKGHAAFELSQCCYNQPDSIWWYPLNLLSDKQREPFESCHFVEILGEIGSRWIQRLLVTEFIIESSSGDITMHNAVINDWIDVQDGRYRYLTIHDDEGIKIYIVISEFLACQVIWTP
ncbi:hypothetical protein I2494_06705 [Budviciaceae bacterium BWR-B9]|uniref:HNH endonuclease n=1 Tax=Limnobaculum allomyrinae TaxID=2791986 RepID=A0ABS1INU5_9GAMM|nr:MULTISPECIES: hypothetical protein [Limnobaculum]MBK5143411.1 hypothetical protein [Limnobaculum allomyrinae]MBV7691299.1 hypothetical protein [Limnobaculum sp. M2-1]